MRDQPRGMNQITSTSTRAIDDEIEAGRVAGREP